MIFNSFDEMQKAVDIVNTSPHPANKIAASIFGTDERGMAYSIARTNFWPQPIMDKIGAALRIGGASGTIHAETAVIFAGSYTNGASLCVTDPFCPNCAKNMAEAGIRTVYIDHKGFDKDFASRRGDEFLNLSMSICEKAGISVYEIRRKEQKLSPILEIPKSYRPAEENPIQVALFEKTPSLADFAALVRSARMSASVPEGGKFAMALAADRNRKIFSLLALPHAAPGFAPDEAEKSDGKYSVVLEPVNRLLMNAPRRGLELLDGFIYCSQAPTAREQVNLVGAGLSLIVIGNRHEARDEASLAALEMLTKAGILKVEELPG
jgi:dCMP deaminase